MQQDKYYFWLDRINDTLRVTGAVYAQAQGTIHTTNGSFLEELIKTRSDEVRELLFGVK